MKPHEYIKNAQRTAAPASPEMLTRLLDKITQLSYFGNKLIALSEELDGLKKHIFYGTPFFERIPLNPNTDDDVAIRACHEMTIKLIHGVIGKATESGELMQVLLDHLCKGHALDRINIMEELGDDCWYDAEILTAIDSSYTEVWEKNIAKLKKRYGEKFSEESAVNRDLVNERRVLEGEGGRRCDGAMP